jgi:hypothetical protein
VKEERTLFLIVLFAACQAVAQQAPNIQSALQTNVLSASATFTTVRPKFHWLGPPAPVSTEKRPRMIEGLDTRAWTTVAEDDSGKRVFPDAETHEAGLCLMWWGSESPTR